MRKKKKIPSIVSLIIIAFSIGLIYTALAFAGVLELIGNSFTAYPWYFHVLMGFLSFALAITIHELGHYFVLRYYHIPVKAIYVLGLVLVKDKHWQIKFFPRFFLMLGGLVMPVLENITDDDKNEALKNNLAAAIAAGPKTSFFYGIFTTFLLLIALATFNPYFIGFIIVLAIINILMTYLVMKASNLSIGGLFGDFVLTKKIKQSPEFLLTYILSSLNQSDMINDDEKYLWPKLINNLETKPLTSGPNMVFFLNYYLEQVIFNNRIGCSSVDQKINNLKYLYTTDEQSLVTMHHLVYWFYLNNDQPKAFIVLDKINETNYKVSKKVYTYWQKYTQHLLGLADNYDFLIDIKNYHPSETQWLLKPLGIPIEKPKRLK